MSDFFLPYLNSAFHGIVMGSGQKLLICLHGFGESAKHFAPLESTLGDTFTLVAIDMPLHDKTIWKENRVFEKSDLGAIVDLLLEKFGKDKFSLLGYSMGGRLALCLVELMPERIDELIMAAPDGLKNNPWHMFVTQTAVGNWLFRYNTDHPFFFFTLLNTWKRLGLLNQSVYKFALHRMNEPVKRQLVYNVWTNLRRMMPDKENCKQLLAKYNVFTLLVFGKYDRVIPPILGTRFIDGTFPAKIVVMDKGHQLISAELGLIIKNNL
ncbi:alpha/beta hydrolase [Chitinophaga silvatica]|uniref:Alpha/beta hydrolase n=1 Tax=Chitinophaga silvatica TaxID=2282649 RepID=A0A3E1YCL6_9BACT|nr:alpha/beta hydrolase [Chitinophaga silvatica]RFS23995.1 alpha/beta hydrolase [Chitinophaga silvatica]